MKLELYSAPIPGDRCPNFIYRIGDDSSGLFLHSPNNPLEYLEATVIGTLVPQNPTRRIKLENLRHLRTVECKERGDGPKWESNTKFSLYRLESDYGSKDEIVLFCRDGFGSQPFLLYQLEAHKTYPRLAEVLTEGELWDIFDGLVDSFRWGRNLGQQEKTTEIRAAFIEDRLAKRKRRGQDTYDVTITQPNGLQVAI